MSPGRLSLALYGNDETIICYWSPTRTGQWADDNARGRAAAVELAKYVKRTGDFQTFQRVVQTMCNETHAGTPELQGVEVGFMFALGVMVSEAVKP